MLLFLSKEEDVHTDWVEAECNRRGVEYFRFCTSQFPIEIDLSINVDAHGGVGFIETEHATIDLSTVTGIWHRRPEHPTFQPNLNPDYQRQALAEATHTLYGLYDVLSDCRWVNPPSNDRIFRGKIFQYRLAQQLGFQIPRTLISNNVADVTDFFHSCQQQMIFKPLSVMLHMDEDNNELGVYTSLITPEKFQSGLDAISLTPCLFQELVHKAYELRVNVIGNHVWATAIDSQGQDETRLDYRHGTNDLVHAAVQLPHSIETLCLRMCRLMGLRMGNFDFIVTQDGDYVFLEVNVNGQWAWIEHKAGWPICQALVDELTGTDSLAASAFDAQLFCKEPSITPFS